MSAFDIEEIFAEENSVDSSNKSESWKILVVDDDEDVHTVTHLSLDDVVFKKKSIEILDAYSAQEGMNIFREQQDIALILLDVVMEAYSSGLDLIKFIREDLKNNIVRIVLRTGQPGYAPEKKVILDYEIDDYRTKTELTHEHLFTLVISNLRSYNAFKRLDEYGRRLEDMVEEKTKELKKINSDLQSEKEKRMEKEMMLMQQSRLASVGEMIAAIAHQWRQPLNAVGLVIQDLKDAYVHNEFTAEYLYKAVNKSMTQLNYMSNTINDFKNFFKPSKTESLFKPDQAIKDSLSIISAQLKNNFIKIDYQNKAMKETLIRGYPSEFAQVIINILNNARDAILDAREKGTLSRNEGEIAIEMYNNDKGTVIDISDDAGEIPDQILNRIFDPYFTTKESHKGTGIGLYVAKTIIETNMGGKLLVENREGSVTFTIEL